MTACSELECLHEAVPDRGRCAVHISGRASMIDPGQGDLVTNGKQYVRLSFDMPGTGKRRTVWGWRLKSPGYFGVCDRYGTRVGEIIVSSEDDDITVRPAGLSRTYGELQVIE